jgi:outer membrane protein OmpA-like peptidoglycan-associated protein
MKIKFRFLAVFLIGLCITSCNTTGNSMVSTHGNKQLSYKQYLKAGYRQLSDYERFFDNDEEAADHFLKKSKSSFSSKYDVDNPDTLNISDKLKDKMRGARIVLFDALTHLNFSENARLLAEAQTNYDCWLERENDKNSNSDACMDLFYQAIRSLNLKNNNKHSIYFESGEAILDEAAKSTAKIVSQEFAGNDLWRVRLIGRTDSKGSYEQNVILSMRRAIAVKNTLAQYGVDPDKIVIEAVGAVGANISEEDKDENNARRVEVLIAPIYVAFDNKGPDIQKIAPHFFSASGKDW